MLVRYFRRPSRIEQLRSSTGGNLLEGFAKELSESRYQWVAAREHIRAADHFSIGSPIESCRSRALRNDCGFSSVVRRKPAAST
jgi:hypothetical protein